MSDNTLYAVGFDDAIVGIDCISFPARVIYDKNKMVDILVERDNMELDEAIEFLEYNTWCAYVGEGTPIFAHIGSKTEVEELIKDFGI